MKYALSKRVVLGLMTAMIVASPVFAETTPSMSRPVDTKGRPQSTQSQAKDIKAPQDATAAEAPIHSRTFLRRRRPARKRWKIQLAKRLKATLKLLLT